VRVPAAIPGAAIVAGAAAGTLLADRSSLPALVLLLLGLVAAFVCFRRRPTLFVCSTCLLFGASACALAQRSESEARSPPLRNAIGDRVGGGPVWLEGRLRGDAAVGDSGVTLTLDVDRWQPEEVRAPVWGGVRLTVTGAIALQRLGDWRSGRRVRLPALLRLPGRYLDPGVADGRLALARRGIALLGSVKSGALVGILANGGWAAELAGRVRAFARRAVHRRVGRFDPQSEAIVIAILIGDRVGLDDEVQRRLQEAGTYHVLAISGGNIAIVAGVFLWLLRISGANHRLAAWTTMVVLVFYAEVVDGGASVARATLMALCYLLARQAGLRSAPLNALAVSAAVLLVVSPGTIADVGFWLTFGATLGIVLGVERAGVRLPDSPWLRAPAALLLASACAELALFPVSARAFSRVTFAGLALNFVAIPMMSIAQVAGMLSVALDAVWGRGADATGMLAHLGAAGLVRSAALVEVVPWVTYRLPPPHALAMAGYYAGWCARLAPGGRPSAARPWRSLRRVGAASVVLCGAWILVEPATLLAPGVLGRLRVCVLDVGHGDAVLLQLPDRRSLLIDTGGSMSEGSFDVGGRVVAPALWALGTRRLDVLVVTHGDPDHAGGAASVVRDFRPREIWEGIPVPKLAVLQRLKAQAASAGIAWRERRAGDRIAFGGVSIAVHHPPPPDWERQQVRNDDSLVLELRYGDVSLALLGDVGRDVERDLPGAFRAARIRLVKVPHHGSATSSSEAFVAALHPTVALLSAGATTKISPDVLQRYRDAGAVIFRTDRDGAITLDTDGRSVTVKTFTGRRAVFAR
jgi:competence protein ComEC